MTGKSMTQAKLGVTAIVLITSVKQSLANSSSTETMTRYLRPPD